MHAAADVQGDAAYTLLEQVFTDLQLTQDTSKEEVINQVTKLLMQLITLSLSLKSNTKTEKQNHTWTANNKKNQVGIFIDLVFLILAL